MITVAYLIGCALFLFVLKRGIKSGTDLVAACIAVTPWPAMVVAAMAGVAIELIGWRK